MRPSSDEAASRMSSTVLLLRAWSGVRRLAGSRHESGKRECDSHSYFCFLYYRRYARIPCRRCGRSPPTSLKQKLKGRKQYPLVLMLEPLYRCNLACAGCGKIQYPGHILKRELTPEECFRAVDECGVPTVAIPGGEPLHAPADRRDCARAGGAQEVCVHVHQRAAAARKNCTSSPRAST